MADSGAPPGENLTLAQIAAQQTAAMQAAMQGRGRGRGRGRGGEPKPKKLTKAQIAAQERAAAAHAAQAAAVASAAPQIPMHQMPAVPIQMPPPAVPVLCARSEPAKSTNDSFLLDSFPDTISVSRILQTECDLEDE